VSAWVDNGRPAMNACVTAWTICRSRLFPSTRLWDNTRTAYTIVRRKRRIIITLTDGHIRDEYLSGRSKINKNRDAILPLRRFRICRWVRSEKISPDKNLDHV